VSINQVDLVIGLLGLLLKWTILIRILMKKEFHYLVVFVFWLTFEVKKPMKLVF